MPDLAPASTAPEPQSGALIVILGPSGAGKDTLLDWVSARMVGDPSVLFVRRVVTRPSQAGGEVHDSFSNAEFDRALDEGRFCFSWAANGMRYGLPRNMADHLAGGGLAVVNGSRGAFAAMRQVFGQARAVEITADRETLKARLLARRRESAAEIEARLDRAAALCAEVEPDLRIDNSGSLDAAGRTLADFLAGCRAVKR
ncbi:ribose 1,5-bisphosphokinase [Hoeflea marina]|uniref:Ribose 1,5-bisphosphate phosphokinase PhnN n=1 Tax=Hoeflea marina TaxID=274592 RepID=A0A317PFS7_9HYPH|nr:phosphonate metabolism protein/1,5-bisphosphokinase (PRPP-forming) PhnN [Hoeflea marina]PWV98874.1 ribose 1,5-bisphosphokinase [Hoeflea marina]